jgi:hypothetical protein
MALQPLWTLTSFQSPDLFTIGRTSWTSDQLVARPLNTGQHKHRINTYTLNIRAISGIRTHDHSVRANEHSSCLRPLGYRDRLASKRAKTVHGLDRAATVTGVLFIVFCVQSVLPRASLNALPISELHDVLSPCVWKKRNGQFDIARMALL